MRFSPALFRHAEKLLSDLLGSSFPADLVVANYFRQHRELGHADRGFVAEAVFAVLRRKRSLAARCAEEVSSRRLLLAGIALFTTAAGACAFAPDLGWLIAIRFFQGIGAATMMALSVALIGDLTAKDQTGRAMGLLGSMSAIGTALGPALGGLLISAFGWPSIFLVNVPLGLGAFALLLCQLPADRGARTARLGDFDISGMVLLALSVAAYALGFTRQHDGFGVGNLAFLGLAAGGMVFFLQMQKRTASPLCAWNCWKPTPCERASP